MGGDYAVFRRGAGMWCFRKNATGWSRPAHNQTIDDVMCIGKTIGAFGSCCVEGCGCSTVATRQITVLPPYVSQSSCGGIFGGGATFTITAARPHVIACKVTLIRVRNTCN